MAIPPILLGDWNLATSPRCLLCPVQLPHGRYELSKTPVAPASCPLKREQSWEQLTLTEPLPRARPWVEHLTHTLSQLGEVFPTLQMSLREDTFLLGA